MQSKNSSISHVNDSDEEPNTPHQMTHKLKGQKKVALSKPRQQRKSILQDTIGSNSELDKTMSNLGGTFNFTKDFAE